MPQLQVDGQVIVEIDQGMADKLFQAASAGSGPPFISQRTHFGLKLQNVVAPKKLASTFTVPGLGS